MTQVLFVVFLAGLLLGAPQQLFSSNLVKVSGKVSGFRDLGRDDIFDGAIVIPTFKASDLLKFNFKDLLGPNEKMQVGRLFKVNVPSNFYVPEQKEKYGLFSLKLKKESYSLFFEPRTEQEIFALHFRAPFKKMVDTARDDNAKVSELMALMKMETLGGVMPQRYSSDATIPLSLTLPLSKDFKYSWTRSQAPSSDFDMAVLFQETLSERWTPVDLMANPPQQGVLQLQKRLKAHQKALFIRSENSKDPKRAEIKVVDVRGRSPVVKLAGVPSPLNLQLAGSQQIKWVNPSEKGWLMLLLVKEERSLKESELGLFSSFFNFLTPAARLSNKVDSSEDVLWIDPALGSYSIRQNLNNYKHVYAIHLETNEDTAYPDTDVAVSALVDALKNMRMRKLK